MSPTTRRNGEGIISANSPTKLRAVKREPLRGAREYLTPDFVCQQHFLVPRYPAQSQLILDDGRRLHQFTNYSRILDYRPTLSADSRSRTILFHRCRRLRRSLPTCRRLLMHFAVFPVVLALPDSQIAMRQMIRIPALKSRVGFCEKIIEARSFHVSVAKCDIGS